MSESAQPAAVPCCAMNRHFLVGIVGQLKDDPIPTETCDFVVAWEPTIIIRMKYCPFCGKEITGAVNRVVYT